MMIKKNGTKILASFLAFVMILSMLPTSVFTIAFAAEIESYSIQLTDGTDVLDLDDIEITLTNKENESITSTVKTDDGVAVFNNFVEEEVTYIVSVEDVLGYEIIEPSEFIVEIDETSTDIVLEPLKKVNVSGVVFDENGEGYKGAKVTVSGYVSLEMNTDSNGRYEFQAYAGKENIINIYAKEEDQHYSSISTEAIYNEDCVDVNYTLSLKNFSINTSAGENGVISEKQENIIYGSTSDIEIKADQGYCIDKLIVNGNEKDDATGERSYKLVFDEIKENYDVFVSFKLITYKISFKVSENGDVKYDDGEMQTSIGGNVSIDKIFKESADVENPTKVMVTATPSENYRVSKIEIDGVVEEFFENDFIYETRKHGTDLIMNEDHTFIVEFSKNEYTLTVNCGENGEANWSGAAGSEIKVKYGEGAKLDIIPNGFYKVSEVTVNGESVKILENDTDESQYIEISNVTKNIVVDIKFDEIETIIPSDYFSNEYYSITFDQTLVKDIYKEDKTYVVVLPKNAKVTIKASQNGDEVKYNAAREIGGYEASKKISETTVINNIWAKIKTGIVKVERICFDVSIKIIIDKDAPKLTEIEQPEWTKDDIITITGTASDNGGSGLRYVVWSKDNKLDLETVLTTTENKIPIENGEYSFNSVAGEQNSTYYVYAVDYAGNVSNEKTVQVKIDKTPPKITGFSFSTAQDSIKKELINFTNFGTFYKDELYLTVSATDENVSSGLNTIKLYYGDNKYIDGEVKNNQVIFKLTEDKFYERTKIYAIVTDNAGNESSNQISPMDQSVDNNQPDIKSDYVQIASEIPTITITPDTSIYTDSSGAEWYNEDVNFNVVTEDNVSGIRFVEIKINGEPISTDLDNNNLTQDFSTGESPVTEKSFSISTSQKHKDGENTIEVTVTNNAGVKSTITSKVYIDNTYAKIIDYEFKTLNGDLLSKVVNFLTFGIFCNEQIKITVTAEDENASAGIKSITLYTNNKEYTENVVNNKAIFILTEAELADKTVFSTDLSAIATDCVGNETATPVYPTEVDSEDIIKNDFLMIENIAPTAIIELATTVNEDKNEATKDEKVWCSNDVEFIVNVVDENSGIRDVLITINGTKVVQENFYNDLDNDIEIYKKSYTVSTKDIEMKKDGSYTVVASVTDNAGNVFTTKEYVIYKDSEDPFITEFDFQATDYIEGEESIVGDSDEALVITTDYGFYFKDETNVIITAKDKEPSAGVKSITYYTVDFSNNPDGIKSAEKTVLVNEDNQIVVTIPINFKGQIYARATDNVLNETDKFVNPNKTIIETQEKHDSAIYDHIVFEKDVTNYTANDGTELYANDVDVTITVEDKYSGIREIEWSVVAPYDTENNQNGKVTIKNDKTVVDGSDTDWIQVENEMNLVTKMKKNITVKNNSNNIIVFVKMTDRIGNISTDSIEFSIDKIDPNISIVYGEDEVYDAEYTNFFNTKRTAIITVTERNFRAADIMFAIENTDKNIPTVDLKDDVSWTTIINSTEPDKTIHVATIKYEQDGDYTFDISYKDNVERPANIIETQKFTIDMTIPEVSVFYNNTSATNENYYNADRIATVVIKEHNFDSSRVNVIGVATDNGEPSAFPLISTWKDNGNDIYTATISYTADSKYYFDIEFFDKANNSIADYTPEEFYVDKTAPNLSVSGIADKSANNGVVAPIITCNDTNFNKDAVSIILSGIYNGDTLQYSGSFVEIPNGQVFTYDNFEKIKSVDDIYTLSVKATDMAGNETELMISFSVNRFGSVYNLSGLEDILTKYIQTGKDIVFTETNVDSLARETIKIKVIKNGTPFDLIEGRDYTIEVAGGNGKWSVYTYTIKKELFEDDGRYSIVIYSKDTAGNINENIDNAKTAEISFGIDKTNPVVVPIDIESGVQYPVDMKTVSIEIKDNLVLSDVKIYLNGKEIDYIVNGEIYTFDIGKSNNKQDVKVIAIDAAGNKEVVKITQFLVNANIVIRFINNTPLFVGSIIGALLLALGIAGFIIFGKKEKRNNVIK